MCRHQLTRHFRSIRRRPLLVILPTGGSAVCTVWAHPYQQADSGRVSSGEGPAELPPDPDPQVPARARRRRFTARYKLDILTAYDAAPDGEKGALLRREGLYSSHIVEWRRAREVGALAGLAQPRGRRRRDPQQERITELEAQKLQLEQELAKARFVVEVQAKLHALLETISEREEPERGSTP